jgi:hypothetical protein
MRSAVCSMLGLVMLAEGCSSKEHLCCYVSSEGSRKEQCGCGLRDDCAGFNSYDDATEVAECGAAILSDPGMTSCCATPDYSQSGGTCFCRNLLAEASSDCDSFHSEKRASCTGPGDEGVCEVGDKICSDETSCPCGTVCSKFCPSCDKKCSMTCTDDADCATIGGADGTPWRCVSYPDGSYCWF